MLNQIEFTYLLKHLSFLKVENIQTPSSFLKHTVHAVIYSQATKMKTGFRGLHHFSHMCEALGSIPESEKSMYTLTVSLLRNSTLGLLPPFQQ